MSERNHLVAVTLDEASLGAAAPTRSMSVPSRSTT